MMNRQACILVILVFASCLFSCKTALVDKTEYETGWEFDVPQQQQASKGKKESNQKGNSKHKHDTKPTDKKPEAGTASKPVPKPTTPNSGIANASLRKEVDLWLGVPYKYGGTTKAGVDCSGFCANVFRNVYNINLGRSAQDIFDQSKPVKKDAVKEGDLVFFKINSSRVSHVGIYLSQNKFVHASTSRGVIISDLNETYWTKYYIGAGSVKQ